MASRKKEQKNLQNSKKDLCIVRNCCVGATKHYESKFFLECVHKILSHLLTGFVGMSYIP